MADSITIRTHASAPLTLIKDEGVYVPAAGASETFDDPSRVERLKTSSSLLTLLTDNAYGTGLSTLVLLDLSGNDVAQGNAADFLAGVGGPSKVSAAKRSSVSPNLVHWGRSSASVGAEDPAAAEWQIYRTDDNDVVLDKSYAGGTTLFDKVWNDRESLTYAWYSDRLALHEPNVVLVWEFEETTGLVATDSSAAGNDGTHTNAPDVDELPDHPLSLGSTRYTGISSRTLSPAGVFNWGESNHTVAFRFKSDGTGTRVSFYSDGVSSGYVAALVASDQDFEFRFFDGTTLHNFVVVGSYHDGAWHDVVYRIDYTGNALELWLDGVSQGTITITANPTTSSGQVWVGDGNFLAAHLGNVEMVAVLSKAITDAQAAGLYL